MFVIIIHFANGSKSVYPFQTFAEAGYFCCDKVSYSSNRIRRVEITEPAYGSIRAMWDSSWDDYSRARGLRIDPI